MEELFMKRIRFISILMTAILLMIADTAFSYADGDGGSVSSYIDEFRTKTKCNAVSVAVVTDDTIEVYGDAEGLYQIGSMTKAFTGLAVQKLIADGLLSENDTVSDLLPDFAAFYGHEACDITIDQLLTQTSGYTNSEKLYPSASKDMTLMEWTDSISGKELSSRPGEKCAYSNVNYNLLGAVIEKVSGLGYREYMETEILVPLGLTNTYVQEPIDGADIISGSRAGYRHAFRYDIPIAPGQIPAGYFYSNAGDMARWIRIWLGTADIPQEYTDLISSIKSKLNKPGDYYSGWELFEDGTTGHSAGTPNYSSRIVFSEENRIGVCVLTNMNVAASTDSLCNGIYASCGGDDTIRISSDVWTVFDLIFTAVTITWVLLIIIMLFVKRRGTLLVAGILSVTVLISICIVMPLVFKAGLKDIAFVWAPYSFTGGLIILTAAVITIAIRLWKSVRRSDKTMEIRKNENRDT